MGDAFAGVTALFAAIAGGLLVVVASLQHAQLLEARAALQQQQFEGLFFRLLDLLHDLTERFHFVGDRQRDPPGEDRDGSAALDAFAGRIMDKWGKGEGTDAELRRLVALFLSNAHGTAPSHFDPYFRMLYEVFKHIAESSLTDRQKIQYANIARGQIGDGTVLLLALNGLTEDGYNFVKFIEGFGLLEHLPADCRHAWPALKHGYRERARKGPAEGKLGRLAEPKYAPEKSKFAEAATQEAAY
ncbi:MAG: putative phage abortive infection protein [Caldimonas sp.]